ncbi:hypothetical protein PR048_000213 [Dryococelus australis]|uniref:Uncharacterized protein n=1 Tax=Dryococelus australis TaxID=614101 RepID=A0ABQ9IEX2_9NEOP|nr:hypothetical protein PR048_000213 [Dryococelus australis]
MLAASHPARASGSEGQQLYDSGRDKTMKCFESQARPKPRTTATRGALNLPGSQGERYISVTVVEFRAMDVRAAREVTSGREICDCEYHVVKSTEITITNGGREKRDIREENPADKRRRPARFPLAKIRERPRREPNPVCLGGRRVAGSFHHAVAAPSYLEGRWSDEEAGLEGGYAAHLHRGAISGLRSSGSASDVCLVAYQIFGTHGLNSCTPPAHNTSPPYSRHMRNAGRPQSVRTVRLEEVIRQPIDDMPSTSTRSLGHQMGVLHSTAWNVLSLGAICRSAASSGARIPRAKIRERLRRESNQVRLGGRRLNSSDVVSTSVKVLNVASSFGVSRREMVRGERGCGEGEGRVGREHSRGFPLARRTIDEPKSAFRHCIKWPLTRLHLAGTRGQWPGENNERRGWPIAWRDTSLPPSWEIQRRGNPIKVTRARAAGETEDPRENPQTNGIVRHDSHMRTSRVTRPGIEPGPSLYLLANRGRMECHLANEEAFKPINERLDNLKSTPPPPSVVAVNNEPGIEPKPRKELKHAAVDTLKSRVCDLDPPAMTCLKADPPPWCLTPLLLNVTFPQLAVNGMPPTIYRYSMPCWRRTTGPSRNSWDRYQSPAGSTTQGPGCAYLLLHHSFQQTGDVIAAGRLFDDNGHLHLIHDRLQVIISHECSRLQHLSLPPLPNHRWQRLCRLDDMDEVEEEEVTLWDLHPEVRLFWEEVSVATHISHHLCDRKYAPFWRRCEACVQVFYVSTLFRTHNSLYCAHATDACSSGLQRNYNRQHTIWQSMHRIPDFTPHLLPLQDDSQCPEPANSHLLVDESPNPPPRTCGGRISKPPPRNSGGRIPKPPTTQLWWKNTRLPQTHTSVTESTLQYGHQRRYIRQRRYGMTMHEGGMTKREEAVSGGDKGSRVEGRGWTNFSSRAQPSRVIHGANYSPINTVRAAPSQKPPLLGSASNPSLHYSSLFPFSFHNAACFVRGKLPAIVPALWSTNFHRLSARYGPLRRPDDLGSIPGGVTPGYPLLGIVPGFIPGFPVPPSALYFVAAPYTLDFITVGSQDLLPFHSVA